MLDSLFQIAVLFEQCGIFVVFGVDIFADIVDLIGDIDSGQSHQQREKEYDIDPDERLRRDVERFQLFPVQILQKFVFRLCDPLATAPPPGESFGSGKF